MNRRTTPLLAVTLCAVTACATWRAQSAPPAEALATTHKLVRVTLTDGTQHTMNLARVEGDSVVGVRTRPTPALRNTVSFPLADVRKVEVAEHSYARTNTLIAVIVACILIIGANLPLEG